MYGVCAMRLNDITKMAVERGCKPTCTTRDSQANLLFLFCMVFNTFLFRKRKDNIHVIHSSAQSTIETACVVVLIIQLKYNGCTVDIKALQFMPVGQGKGS